MQHRSTTRIGTVLETVLGTILLLLSTTPARADQPTPAALAAYQNYVAALEARLARQHSSPDTFLAGAGPANASLRSGNLLLEDLTPPAGLELPGALLHHWRATLFVPNATAQDFSRLLRDFSAYPSTFAPQVVSSQLLAAPLLTQHADPAHGPTFHLTLRVRQHHVLTVVLDTTYAVTFAQLDPAHQSSASRSTHIAEIADPGTPSEHALPPSQDHGYLWRQNTWWSWEERDGGLLLQLESVSLTRSIPYGLAWAVGPCIATVPRDSLTFTLRAAATALRSAQKGLRP